MGALSPLPLAAIQLPPFDWIMSALAATLLAMVSAWLWSRLIRLTWAMGVDPRRRLAFSVAPVRFLLLLGVAISVVVPPWEDLTRLEVILSASVLAGLGTLWGYRHLRDVAGALTLSFTRGFSIGDQIATSAATGRVISFGLTRVRIQTPYGERVDLPAGALASEAVRVSMRRGGALPIAVNVGIPPAPAPDMILEGLRDHALLSPYADASAPVVVELTALGTARITATPVHPDDADELRSDLMGRAASLAAIYG